MPGRAASLKTEYQRSFRPELFVCSSTTYSNNRALRTNLKSRCQGHSHDPFVWQDDDDFDSDLDDHSGADEGRYCESVGGTGDAGVDRRRPAFVPPHRFKHELWRRMYEKRLQRQFDQKAVQTDPEGRDFACDTERDSDSHDEGSDDEASVLHVVNASSANKQTQTPDSWLSPEKPPFAPYGYQNDEIEVGGKRTYNVKAAQEIYPSALRAMRQREQDQLGVRYSSSALSGRCQDVESTARRMTNSVPALTRAEQRSGGGGAGAGTDWQTEYEREFRAYEPYRYQTVRRDKAIHVRSPDLLPSTPRIHRSYLSIS